MSDQEKSRSQLITELEASRRRVIALEAQSAESERMEASLLESDRILDEIIELSPVALAITDQRGNTLKVNGKFFDLFGYTLSEIRSSRDWAPLVYPDPDYREKVLALWEEDLARAEVSSSRITAREYQMTCRDGVVRTIAISVKKVRKKHLITFADNTEYKRAEDELKESNRRNEALLAAMPEMMFVLTRDGIYTDFNVDENDELPIPQEEIIGKSLLDVGFPDENVQMILGHVKETLRDGKKHSFEYELEVGANIKFYSAHMVPFGGDKILATVRNVTDQKLAADALRKSEEKYRILVENANDAISVAQDGMFKFTNRKVEEFSGYSLEELQAIPFMSRIHPDDREAAMIRHQKRLKGEKGLNTYSFRIIHKSGSEKTLQANSVLIEWEGQPATLNFLRDITRQVELESQLRQAQKVEAIGTLAGGIAHDFNNALYSMIGYTELVMDDVPPESLAHDNLREIFKSAMRARDMVQQILAFSRTAETERKQLRVQPVVADALKLLRMSLPPTIEIRLNIDGDCGPIMADRTQLHQVVMNLVTNAYHAMRDGGGVLDISVREEDIDSDELGSDLLPGKYVKLTIGDTGHGMESEVLSKIFDPYFTTKKLGEGTGMGLAVVHGIITAHNGNIKVESQVGRGTVFRVLFPVIEEILAESKPMTEDPPMVARERILFVDDDEAIVHMTEQVLERLGHRVTSFTSSVEALRVFEADPNRYDLVITDMTMPHMTGVELVSRLRAVRPDIPVILCTGFSEAIDESGARELGISAFVLKPLLKDDLAKTIEKVVTENRKG